MFTEFELKIKLKRDCELYLFLRIYNCKLFVPIYFSATSEVACYISFFVVYSRVYINITIIDMRSLLFFTLHAAFMSCFVSQLNFAKEM